jgi:hypothetical protein
MQQRGIKQSQGFQVIYILLHSYIYIYLLNSYFSQGKRHSLQKGTEK